MRGDTDRSRLGVPGSALAGALLTIALLAAGCTTPTEDGAGSATGSGPAGPVASAAGPVASAAGPDSSDAGHWDFTRMPSPCRLIQAAELGGVLGADVGAGMDSGSWPPLCKFLLDPATQTFVFISDDSQPTGKADFDREHARSGAVAVAAELGDQAFWLPDSTALHVMDGQTHVAVMFWGSKVPAGAQAKAVAVAKIILPRTR